MALAGQHPVPGYALLWRDDRQQQVGRLCSALLPQLHVSPTKSHSVSREYKVVEKKKKKKIKHRETKFALIWQRHQQRVGLIWFSVQMAQQLLDRVGGNNSAVQAWASLPETRR